MRGELAEAGGLGGDGVVAGLDELEDVVAGEVGFLEDLDAGVDVAQGDGGDGDGGLAGVGDHALEAGAVVLGGAESRGEQCGEQQANRGEALLLCLT